jgi:hypothetical protein
VNPEKPLNNTHKINFAMFTKKTVKECLNCRVFGEVDKVINVKSKQERMHQGLGIRLRRVADKSHEEVRIFKG